MNLHEMTTEELDNLYDETKERLHNIKMMNAATITRSQYLRVDKQLEEDRELLKNIDMVLRLRS